MNGKIPGEPSRDHQRMGALVANDEEPNVWNVPNYLRQG
jgi:hypothetical protein